MQTGEQCPGCGNDYDPMHPCKCTRCPRCGGEGCVDDDPEVRGSAVECWKCNGAGWFVQPCCDTNEDGLPKCDGSCLPALA
jgi:hypothetical protein